MLRFACKVAHRAGGFAEHGVEGLAEGVRGRVQQREVRAQHHEEALQRRRAQRSGQLRTQVRVQARRGRHAARHEAVAVQHLWRSGRTRDAGGGSRV
jgi:hypothetical protein